MIEEAEKSYPYSIDLEKLSQREFENLCFELLTQMGFRPLEWMGGPSDIGIDIVAALPKKDPDGYEYQELWFIAVLNLTGTKVMFDNIILSPKLFLKRLSPKIDEFKKLKYKQTHGESLITVLIISRRENISENNLKEVQQAEELLNEIAYQPAIRFRVWDKAYLARLIRQYPQIAFKYFSEEVKNGADYRKTTRELYLENVEITKQLEAIKNTLQEEKKKRFVAERDAAWKDVAFRAAHKLGNPLDAVDTFLQSLKKRIQQKKYDDAHAIAEEMDAAVEDAKRVIAQFKSLIKSQEIKPQEEKLIPLLRQACRLAEEKGVSVTFKTDSNMPKVLVDGERIAECFSELVANSLHWLDKPKKEIRITAARAVKRNLPDVLDRDQRFLRIRFEDNGCGIPLDRKEKIFAPFYSTYAQGTGLGLSMVKSIIDAHGGTISENGTPGNGASFEIYLQTPKPKRSK